MIFGRLVKSDMAILFLFGLGSSCRKWCLVFLHAILSQLIPESNKTIRTTWYLFYGWCLAHSHSFILVFQALILYSLLIPLVNVMFRNFPRFPLPHIQVNLYIAVLMHFDFIFSACAWCFTCICLSIITFLEPKLMLWQPHPLILTCNCHSTEFNQQHLTNCFIAWNDLCWRIFWFVFKLGVIRIFHP